MKTLPISLFVAALAVGCGPGYAPSANNGEDAALVEDGGADAGSDDAGADADGTPDGDAEAGRDAEAGSDGGGGDGGDGGGDEDTGPTTCVPNHDGVVERSEVTLQPGLHATFKVAEDVEIDTQGTEQDDGSRVWDLSGDLPGDRRVLVELRSAEGTWFKPQFPDLTYVSELSGAGDKIGVFGVDDQGLYMQGIVSADDGFDRTELQYDPPAQILQFPIEQGTSWQSESEVSGRFEGSSLNGSGTTETYSSQVDAHGTMKTPFGDFEVLRVRTVLDRDSVWAWWASTTLITYTFVAECFGTVATIRSEEGEDDPEFSRASEVRRLAQ
ncbi:MAG: hypothetical protein ACLFVJ_07160 [Persicimonas sp.]